MELVSGALHAVSTTAPRPLTHSFICPSALPNPPSWPPWGASGSSLEGLGLNKSCKKNRALILCFHTEAVGNLLNSVTAAGTAKYATVCAKPHPSLCLSFCPRCLSHLPFFTLLSHCVCQSPNCLFTPFFLFPASVSNRLNRLRSIMAKPETLITPPPFFLAECVIFICL